VIAFVLQSSAPRHSFTSVHPRALEVDCAVRRAPLRSSFPAFSPNLRRTRLRLRDGGSRGARLSIEAPQCCSFESRPRGRGRSPFLRFSIPRFCALASSWPFPRLSTAMLLDLSHAERCDSFDGLSAIGLFHVSLRQRSSVTFRCDWRCEAHRSLEYEQLNLMVRLRGTDVGFVRANVRCGAAIDLFRVYAVAIVLVALLELFMNLIGSDAAIPQSLWQRTDNLRNIKQNDFDLRNVKSRSRVNLSISSACIQLCR
jgi:hypothetical protein